MNKIWFIGVIVILLSSCAADKSKKMLVTAKWNFIQFDALNCDDDGTNSPTSCVFNYKGKRYLRKESYKLNLNGKIDSIYSYRIPLGVNIYSIKEYGTYLMSSDNIDFKQMKKNKIEWNNKTQQIVENKKNVEHTLIEDHKVIVRDGDKLIIYDLTDKKSR